MKTGGTASTRIRLRETRALRGPEDFLPVIANLLSVECRNHADEPTQHSIIRPPGGSPQRRWKIPAE